MILYEYECQTCGTVMEVSQSIKDNKLEEYECSKCHTIQPVKKIITAMHFELKGRGWSKDGYTNTYNQTLDQM